MNIFNDNSDPIQNNEKYFEQLELYNASTNFMQSF